MIIFQRYAGRERMDDYNCKLCNEVFYSLSGLCQHECKMGDLLE